METQQHTLSVGTVQKLCRLCAEYSKEDNKVAIFSDKGQAHNLAHKINSSLPISVTARDLLPMSVCLRCMQGLEMVHEMREKCRDADRLLHCLMGEDTQGEDNTTKLRSSPTNKSQTEVQTRNRTIFKRSSCKLVERVLLQLARPPPPLKCDECGVSVADADSFCSHQRSLHGRLAVTCSACCVFFSSAMQLREHQEEVHPLPSPGPKVMPVRNSSNKQETSLSSIKSLAEPRVVVANSFSSIQTRANPSAKYQISIATVHQKETKKTKRSKYVKKHYICHCKMKFNLDERVAYKVHLAEHRAVIRAEKLKTATIQCDYCEVRFLMEKSKRHHMLVRHRDYKPFMCDLCGKSYHAKSTLRDHIYSHANELSVLCSVCGKAFKSKTSLRDHARSHAPSSAKCTVCSKAVQPHRLKWHMRRHFGDRSYSCSVCARGFHTASNLRQHMATHTNDIHECDLCGSAFNRKNNLTEHKKRHIDKETKQYVCPVNKCKRQFPTKDEVILHCNEHSNEDFLMKKTFRRELPKSSYYCWFCEQYFRDLNIYINHMTRHQTEGNTQELKLSCSICVSHYSDASLFIEHLSTHPEAYTYNCHFCSENFVTYEQRISHESAVHSSASGGGMLECNICSKRFATKTRLKLHQVVHTGVRPFHCPHCTKSFYFKRYLTGHITIHTGERKFVCEYCSQSFRLKADLQQHLSTHTGEKAHKCNICNFSSHRRKDLVHHQATKHAEQMSSENR